MVIYLSVLNNILYGICLISCLGGKVMPPHFSDRIPINPVSYAPLLISSE